MNEAPSAFDELKLRTPPHSIEAESAVLGGMLLQPEAAWDRVGDMLIDADFYRREHAMIFSAIGHLTVTGKDVDVITVYEHLRNAGTDDDVGGLPYLNSLAQFVPSASNIRRYAEIIRERSVQRKLASAGDAIAASALEPAGKSVAELQDEAERRILSIGDGGRKGDTAHTIESLVVTFLDEIQVRAENPDSLLGVRTGLIDLDRRTLGLQRGDLVVLAARPSMGKTALAMNIAEHVALHEDLPVAVFSMEMGAPQLTLRLVGSIGSIDQQHLRTGNLSDDEWPRLTEAVEKLRNVRLHIDDAPGLSVSELRSSARRMARLHGGKLGLVVVDYLQLMAVSAGMSKENRATAVGEISRGLKMLAKELDCPVIALSQLSRGVESRNDKRPMMSDLRESGAIEQDADLILFIYRDDYYNKDSKEPGVAELIISKQRSGPTGTVKLAFRKELTRFENLAFTEDA